jgi:hypothetical protein
VRDPIEQAQYDETINALEKLLDESTLKNALNEGESLILNDVVATALANAN